MHLIPQDSEFNYDDWLDAQDAAEEALQKEMFGRLANFLLNPELDRCDIADGILGDAELIQYLQRFENILLDATAPRGATWSEIQAAGLSYGSITMMPDRPRSSLTLPLLLGCTSDEHDRLWHQASPQEFIPAHDEVQTSNLCGEPVFYAGRGGSMSSKFISANKKFSPGLFQYFQLC